MRLSERVTSAPHHEHLLREAGLRVTQQRVAVLEAVRRLPHADTESLIAAVRAEHGEVSHQAVYDVLRALTEAGLVLGHLGLAEVIARERRAGHLEELTPREHEVLELMARGLSNAAICAELHLSIKTVEPAVGAIFAKLGLHADPGSNRRVLAVLAFVRD